jgi:dGTPase
MKHTKKDWEATEAAHLAPYATRSAESKGRHYPQSGHPLRSCFSRDRDRILHSKCFRRLEYKTQVFVNGTADHYRTRLTHTMEMTAVGRTLARILKANEDLTECICLAHDIGHSPFGHAGEHALDELMKNHGGFDHNLQSLRCVETIESPYPDVQGLNLSWEVRAGLLKHEAHIENAKLDGFPIGPFQAIEAQISDISDDMTYQAHDVDDGLEAGIVTLEQLEKTEFWRRAADATNARHTTLTADQFLRATIRNLLELQMIDVMEQSFANLEKQAPSTDREIMTAPARTIDYSSEMKEVLSEFTAFMFEHLYFHHGVADTTQESVTMMRKLFLHYIEHPETMGQKARARIETEGLWRTVCDYVAGCTDRYAIAEYHRFVSSSLEPAQ